MNAELKKSMKVAGDEARYDAYAKRLLSEKIVLAHILVKVVDEFRGMKPQDVVRYIEGDVRIGDVPLELPEEWEEEMQDMYSFAAEIRKKGEARGICIMARNMLKNGVPISQIAQMAEVSVEKLQSWLQEADTIAKE